MSNFVNIYPEPKNEPVLDYAKGSKERELLEKEVARQMNMQVEVPVIINGKEIKTGNTKKMTMPHNHGHVLGVYHEAGEAEVQMAIEAAVEAQKIWQSFSWEERVALNLRVADLLATKYRFVINAATMLGQGKNCFQAEIDAACETIDFLRFNAHYMCKIYQDQPVNSPGVLNKMEYRPLEGFVFALSPFNFTAIASNLAMSPVLMGNTVVWKPSSTAILSNYYLMKIYKEAGLPDGVINFIPGKGSTIGNIVMPHKDLAGIHFTGSTKTFNHLWKTIGDNLPNYRCYPTMVGETGGKDFVFAHKSANSTELATALVRGAFEYQGQKCSAASRAYIPQSLWADTKDQVAAMLAEIKMGDVNDFSNFFNAVIDETSFDKIMSYIDFAKESNEAEVIFGGEGDKSKGYFIQPTVILTTNPHFKSMEEEIFGPVLTIYLYEDDKYEETLHLCDETSPYALTGAIFAKDRKAVDMATEILKFAAGNFYINDKPTGAVVGQQPFGGARGSGTNDKSGSFLNLFRWSNPRTIKEALVPPTDYKYPFLG